MNNPPAFPTSHQEPCDYNGHNNSKKTVIDQGMTLRDYFAAKAMQSILVGIECAPDDVKNVVESAYVLADAMLAAREQQ